MANWKNCAGKNLMDKKKYPPITCMNTSYKIMTGAVAKYMREHTMDNKIWDEGQLGTVEGVLGMLDQMTVDRIIMKKVKQYLEILSSHSTTTRRHTIKSTMNRC